MMSPPSLVIPDSPMLDSFDSAFPSPNLRQTAGSSSSRSPQLPPTPRFLSHPTPQSILPLLEEARSSGWTTDFQNGNGNGGKKGKGNDVRTALILRHALKWAIEHTDVDLVSWLVDLEGDDGKWTQVLDEEVQLVEDEDGWGIIGMALQSSCGRQEPEEIVRLLVGRWGINVGPRGGRDRTGWTPLHLAAIISTPPLISFLLNRGASPHALTNKGLTPLDLVSGMPDRTDIAVFLEHSSASALVPPATEEFNTSLSARRQAMLQRRRQHAAMQLRKMEESDRNQRIQLERERWIRDMASIVEVSPELLLPESRRRSRQSDDSGLGSIDDWEEAEEESEEEDSGGEDEGIGDGYSDSPFDHMLVFSLSHLPSIFDIFISTYRPDCIPLANRTLPANALFLYARFAHYRCDESWLEELIEGAVQRIEQGVYGNVEDLAYLAFWAYNTTVLIHLLRSDHGLSAACEELNLLGMMEELVNAIHVFVIRVAERRIDAILDPALLDYETLEDFNDVRFEGEWSLFRSFGGNKRRQVLPKASQIFANGNGSPNPHREPPSSPSSLLHTLRDNVAAASPLKSLASKQSIHDLVGVATPRSTSMDSLATVSGVPVSGLDESASPSNITEILSGVLLVLQLYEVNPAITIQAFSQIFFWIACELFNRILSRKKYLCRSKAVQIQMNITVLEDWVRANGLPTQTAKKHLEPVTQLLSWLQCLSQVREFDTLIGTMQSLKGINPLQMRKAVRDYRYEVNEGRMTEECAQYLAQLQKDWEKRRVRMSMDAMHERSGGSEASVSFDSTTDDSTPIDALFDGTTALADFVPPAAPECLGELLDSRFMLPFLLPSDNEYLVATPPTDAAFANAGITTPFSDAGRSRPSSRSSFASSRPMGWALPRSKKLRQLPRDFFPWLNKKEAERRHQRESLRPRKDLVPAMDPPLGPSQRLSLPSRPSMDLRQSLPLSALSEEDTVTPIATASSVPYPTGGFPSPGLKTSDSLDQLREKSKIPFEVVAQPVHIRSDSYELKTRRSLNPISQTPVTPTRITPASAPLPLRTQAVDIKSPHYELARNRRDSAISPTSPNALSPGSTNGSSSTSKKWWKMGRSVSSNSVNSVGSDRLRREASEDTVVAGGR